MKKTLFDYKTVNSMSRDAAARYMLDIFPKEHLAPVDNAIILPDTALCAIVRDEIVNPAHGIVDFVHSTVPYVEEAVLVDTGSIDGTREVLEELQCVYPHLVVKDEEFTTFASVRNYSLSVAISSNRLVLDADERILKTDFEELLSAFLVNGSVADTRIGFTIFNVTEDNARYRNPDTFYNRFLSSDCFFKDGFSARGAGEMATYSDNDQYISAETSIPIFHFAGSQKLVATKESHVYEVLSETADMKPAVISNRNLWMEPNVHRDAYR